MGLKSEGQETISPMLHPPILLSFKLLLQLSIWRSNRSSININVITIWVHAHLFFLPSWQNMVLETHNVIGTSTKAVLSILAGVYVCVDRFCHILATCSCKTWQVCSWHQNEGSSASQLVSSPRKMVSGSFSFSLLFFC